MALEKRRLTFTKNFPETRTELSMGEVLEAVNEGVNRHFIYNLERSGYITPHRLKKDRIERRLYSRKQVEIIRRVWRLYSEGHTLRSAYQKCIKEPELEKKGVEATEISFVYKGRQLAIKAEMDKESVGIIPLELSRKYRLISLGRFKTSMAVLMVRDSKTDMEQVKSDLESVINMEVAILSVPEKFFLQNLKKITLGDTILAEMIKNLGKPTSLNRL